MARLTRTQSRQQTRERLLDAARDAFTREGYAGASVDVIAERAGFSKGAFYSNFESKEAIFLELLEAHMGEEVAISSGFAPQNASAEDAIEAIAARYASDPVDLEWCLLSIEFALHATRSPAFAERRAALFARHYAAVAKIIDAIAASAGTRIAEPERAAAVFIALRQGLALERSQTMPAISSADVQRALSRWMLGLVGLADRPSA
ncbi:TetR/AcrR family transcriptional regulator [Erythrobacter sp. NE805]|uniref:TetR/AcrR family transcriptional regulator n=1 Tax=Erythrobacter sp. NE805 TaxID=3389875 RepID=UPI00396B2C5F